MAQSFADSSHPPVHPPSRKCEQTVGWAPAGSQHRKARPEAVTRAGAPRQLEGARKESRPWSLSRSVQGGGRRGRSAGMTDPLRCAGWRRGSRARGLQLPTPNPSRLLLLQAERAPLPCTAPCRHPGLTPCPCPVQTTSQRDPGHSCLAPSLQPGPLFLKDF